MNKKIKNKTQKKKIILIIGSSGLIGKALIEVLNKKGLKPICYDLIKTKKKNEY